MAGCALLDVAPGIGYYLAGEQETMAEDTMEYETLIYQKEGGLGVVTLNRPERLNALSRQLYRELGQVLDEIEQDDEVRVAIVTGNGRAFCAGADIKERVENEEDLRVQRTGAVATRVFRRIETIGKVFIAAVNGYAAGGGCELALACDLRLAATTAQFAQSEVKMGIMPGAGATQRLPRLIGAARAKELMLFGDFIGAQQAHHWGLVNKVVEPGELMVEARAWAKALLERPPISLAMIKNAVNVGMQVDLDSGLEFEQRCSWLLTTTEDRKEGMRAFVEKRKAVFTGR